MAGRDPEPPAKVTATTPLRADRAPERGAKPATPKRVPSVRIDGAGDAIGALRFAGSAESGGI